MTSLSGAGTNYSKCKKNLLMQYPTLYAVIKLEAKSSMNIYTSAGMQIRVHSCKNYFSSVKV